jgi:hypothetical protein
MLASNPAIILNQKRARAGIHIPSQLQAIRL